MVSGSLHSDYGRVSPLSPCGGHVYSLPDPVPALMSARTPRAVGACRPRSVGAGAGPSAGPSGRPAPSHGLPLRAPSRLSPAVSGACADGVEGGARALRGHFRPRAAGLKIKASFPTNTGFAAFWFFLLEEVLIICESVGHLETSPHRYHKAFFCS